jgi:hypothetical protein
VSGRRDWSEDPASDDLDLDQLAADDAQLDLLAAGGTVETLSHSDPALAMLAALRGELDAQLRPARPGAPVVPLQRGRSRGRHLGRGAVAGLVVAGLAFTSTGAAAALSAEPGDLLYGIRKVITGPVDDTARRTADRLVRSTVRLDPTLRGGGPSASAAKREAEAALATAAALIPAVRDPDRRTSLVIEVRSRRAQLGLPALPIPTTKASPAAPPLPSPSAGASPPGLPLVSLLPSVPVASLAPSHPWLRPSRPKLRHPKVPRPRPSVTVTASLLPEVGFSPSRSRQVSASPSPSPAPSRSSDGPDASPRVQPDSSPSTP